MEVSKKVSQPKSYYTGFCMGKVIAVNPTKEEVAEIYGFDLKDDAKNNVYEGTTQDKLDFCELVFYIQAQTPEKQIFPVRFKILNKQVKNKDGDKHQYVNQSGQSAWIDNPENLKSWFIEFQDFNTKKKITSDNEGSLSGDKKYRIALQGEADLYNFLRAFLGKANFSSQRTNILINIEKMFRDLDGFVESEYRSVIKAGDDGIGTNFGFFCYVTVGEKDGEVKYYQTVYKDFIPAGNFKKFSFAINNNDWTLDPAVKKWHVQATGKYGCDGAYELTMLQKIDPSTYQQASDEVVKQADDIDF